jgi:hypothetical protein
MDSAQRKEGVIIFAYRLDAVPAKPLCVAVMVNSFAHTKGGAWLDGKNLTGGFIQ